MDHEKMLRLVKRSRERAEEDQHRLSKDRLRSSMSKRVETTMIGALASIEEHLGFLWEDDSPEGREMRRIFNELRKEILDKGNDQKRQVEKDLNQYQVLWNRYTYEFRA